MFRLIGFLLVTCRNTKLDALVSLVIERAWKFSPCIYCSTLNEIRDKNLRFIYLLTLLRSRIKQSASRPGGKAIGREPRDRKRTDFRRSLAAILVHRTASRGHIGSVQKSPTRPAGTDQSLAPTTTSSTTRLHDICHRTGEQVLGHVTLHSPALAEYSTVLGDWKKTSWEAHARKRWIF